MVEQTFNPLDLDAIFASLADATRRDILQRVASAELSIGEIAAKYDLTFAAVSKHLQVLERAKLIVKERRGKQQMVKASPAALQDAADYLAYYEQLWGERLDALEALLKEDTNGRS